MEDSEKYDNNPQIRKYKEPDKKVLVPASGQSSINQISDHIEKYIGHIHSVFHEIVSYHVHIDVYWVKPTRQRPFHTLITSGMSDKPMNTSDGLEGSQYAELSICLPEHWKLSDDDIKDDLNYWPIGWLKYLARFPHENDTCLGYGYTIPNGNPAAPLTEGTQLNTMLLLPTIVFNDEFHELVLPNKTIQFYSLIPLYAEEIELKLSQGVEALFDGFDKFGVSDVLQLNRPNTVKRRKRFGLF